MAVSEPLISIITPTFNRERTIPLAIESVLAQSYTHWELLIIDDGSEDGTRERLSSYLEDDRIQYHFQENQSQSIARNLGLQYARGALVCFLDSDDLWVPGKHAISPRWEDQSQPGARLAGPYGYHRWIL